MNKKKVLIFLLASVIVGASVFLLAQSIGEKYFAPEAVPNVINNQSKQKPSGENGTAKDQVDSDDILSKHTITKEEMTEEQIKFYEDFKKKAEEGLKNQEVTK